MVASNNIRKVPYAKMYTGRRPKYSERGASDIGPKASPRIYMLNPSVATCGGTSISLAKSPATGEKLDKHQSQKPHEEKRQYRKG